MATTKITKKKLKELVLEEVGKDAELMEIFGNLFSNKKQEENIEIDNVIGRKHDDNNWTIYTRNSTKGGPRPHSFWGEVKIHPDGLMIFTYYPNGTDGRKIPEKKNFKITEVKRAVQYVADELRKKEEKKEAEKELVKKSERDFEEELTEVDGVPGKIIVKVEGEDSQIRSVAQTIMSTLKNMTGNVSFEINGKEYPIMKRR